MISCYTVKKTLLDMGNFEVDGEYSDNTGDAFILFLVRRLQD